MPSARDKLNVTLLLAGCVLYLVVHDFSRASLEPESPLGSASIYRA